MKWRRRSLLTASVAAALVSGKPGEPRAAELGGLENLAMIEPPVPVPDIAFGAADGASHRLSEFVGHGMVVNLWATWCVPCVSEMPSLARLSIAVAPADIAVLPISSDRGGAATVQAFFARHDVTALPVLTDPHGEAMRALGADGLPTTLIVDREGRVRARLEGAADWSSPAAVAMVRRLAG